AEHHVVGGQFRAEVLEAYAAAAFDPLPARVREQRLDVQLGVRGLQARQQVEHVGAGVRAELDRGNAGAEELQDVLEVGGHAGADRAAEVQVGAELGGVPG